MITTEIERLRFNHISLTSQSPTKLYLGRVEWERMKDLAQEMCCHRMERDVTGDRRSEYRGMKIYNVDDESYLAVGA